jgi:type I restriction enzyme, S subunit
MGDPEMNEWKEYRFSDAIEICPTISLKGNANISYVEMKDLNDGTRYCYPSIERELCGGSRFQDRDTLFARITPCLENGKICQVMGLKDGVGFGSTEFLVFRGTKDITTNDFVFYLSRSEEVRSFAEQNFDGTSGRQRVPKTAFDNLFIEIPPLLEQRAIAGVLSSLDDKIDLLYSQNKTLEGMAEVVWHNMLVDRTFTGWLTTKLGDVCEIQNGYAFRSSEYKEYQPGFLEVLKMGHIKPGGGLRSDPKKDFVPMDNKLKRWILNKGDIVVSACSK